MIEQYSVNLTELAKTGELDPVIGRDVEIRNIIEILSRRRKNNPVLIGEAGVGKTAIVEGLALRIANNDVPSNMQDKTIVSLDIAALIAGAKAPGEFESRLKGILEEVTNNGMIMFIDEIHLITGAGGSMNMANLMKPMLARGSLQCIGATTLNEYRENIEKDAALERRFLPIKVQEPSVDDTVSIIRGLKERYEVFHGVRISDAAIISAATLSDRYISDRFMPDKAIDLIDAAGAQVKTSIDSKPEELELIDRRIVQLEIEKASLKNEDACKDRYADIDIELNSLKETSNIVRTKWLSEKSVIIETHRIQHKIETLKAKLLQAEQAEDFQEASRIKYSELNPMVAQYEEMIETQDHSLLTEIVTDEDIATVISRWTGVPLTRLLGEDRAKLVNLAQKLHNRVIGQEKPIQSVSSAIKRAHAGIKNPDQPIGSFLFLGPTGVGKTELAKALAAEMFDDEKNIIRIDMSEYKEKHNVARLIGAPPGYIGHEEGGQLTEAVRRKPYSVILFDEVEKAHTDVFDVLLQVLDDGRLTDSHGRTVDFKNTLIIMTSNIGFERSEDYAVSQANAQKTLMQYFRPEFINRIDDLAIFHALDAEQIMEIVDIKMAAFVKRLSDKNIKLRLTAPARDYLGAQGYSPEFGARALERVLQTELENPIADLIISDDIQDCAILVGMREGAVNITVVANDE